MENPPNLFFLDIQHKNDVKRKSMEFQEFIPIETTRKNRAFIPPRKDSVSQNPLIAILNSLGGIQSIGFEKTFPATIPIPDSDQVKKITPNAWLVSIKSLIGKREKSLEFNDNLSRLSPTEEKHIYEVAHLKRSEPYRPFHQRVLLTNMMLYIIALYTEVPIRGVGPNPALQRQLKLQSKATSSQKPNLMESPANEGKILKK
jgi:hypothetical protein